MAVEIGKDADWNDPLLILERMDEAFYATDFDFRLVYTNKQAQAFWGRSGETLVGRSMLELFPHFQGSPSFLAHVRAIEHKQPVRLETISTATGAPVLLRIFPRNSGLSVYFRDVTDRQSLETKVRTGEELLALAELSAGIGVWEQDLPTATMTATPQFFRLLGIDPIKGPVPQDFVRGFRHPGDRERVTAGFKEAIERGDDSFESEYRIVRPSGEIRWIFGRGRVSRDGKGQPWRYAGVDLDITERKQQDEHLRVVVGELQHRTNNLMAVVQSLAQQTLRGAQTLEDFSSTFSSRLLGLAQSTSLLAEEEWRGGRIDRLVQKQLAPFSEERRFSVSGPEVLLSPKAVQNLGLALHELCTNATKYGSLSVPDGRVEVTWEISAYGPLLLRWRERGGPPVSPPTRKGFGRVVAEQAIESALNAQVSTVFAPDGLQWFLKLPETEFSAAR